MRVREVTLRDQVRLRAVVSPASMPPSHVSFLPLRGTPRKARHGFGMFKVLVSLARPILTLTSPIPSLSQPVASLSLALALALTLSTVLALTHLGKAGEPAACGRGFDFQDAGQSR